LKPVPVNPHRTSEKRNRGRSRYRWGKRMKPSSETRSNREADVAPLLNDIRQLVADVIALQAQARALGVFANDRELLECPSCGLMENVACEGRLFTCRAEALGDDTGLRFEESAPNQFRCPSCGATAREAHTD
jgi:predicted RNA-binding Zn-ribbon protein involved in translation (DUF1610 family)